VAERIAALAQKTIACKACGAAPGEPCTEPGPGRTVHGGRWAKAAIARRRGAKEARLTAEQRAILAALPPVPASEIEACRRPDGGYDFTRAWFLDHGLPWPPIAGWRRAVEREEE
jgi:hypothetical protein